MAAFAQRFAGRQGRRKERSIMMRVRNKETFKRVVLMSGIVVCLFLAGCKDKSVDHYNRGIAYIEKGQYDQAISEFTKAIEINPGFAEAYGNRGAAYFKKGEHDLAISDCNKALEIKPAYAEAYSYRGAAYAGKGQYDLPSQSSTRPLR